MRFMMLMIPSVYRDGKGVGANFTPSAEAVEKMMKYNEELAKSGALLALDGLHSPATAARVSFSRGQAVVSDGLFAGTKEVLGGYWMIQAKSREEAIAWAKRVPAEDGDVIEVRQVFENEDFPPDTRKAADSPVVRAQVEKFRKG